jgi:putative transposase
MRKTKLVNDRIYHVFNRGVEKRDIFLDDQDYFRFIHNLFEFNDETPVINARYYFDPKTMNVESRNINKASKDKHVRRQLVEILLFTLMPNHFHLLLKQRKTNGITKFIQKVCTGYTMYFNKKYKRVGGLVQGRFKAVIVNSQEHFQYLPHYIHTNPLELNYRGPTSIIGRKGMKFLEEYRWSSFPDYIGKKNFPSVTKRDFVLKIFGGEAGYRRFTREFLKELHKDEKVWPEPIQELMLEK